MQQVGDIVTFALSEFPTGSVVYSYVWKWWDATSDATVVPTTQRKLNIGGYPGTRELYYDCLPVAIDGQTTTINGSLSVNNPPSIVGSPSITVNDGYFPYDTQLVVEALDLDGDSFDFSWYQGDTYLGSGTSTGPVSTNGTWVGNDQTVVVSEDAYTNVLDVTVASARTVRCYIVDTAGGTSAIDFELRGNQRPPPSTGLNVDSASVSADASTLASARVGPTETLDYTVYAKDVAGDPVTFTWNFAGSNNWTATEYFVDPGTAMPDGSYRSSYTKSLAAETFPSGQTTKVVTTTVKATSSTASATSTFTTTLLKDNPPSAVSYVVRANGVAIDPSGGAPQGATLEFDATVTDLDGDVVSIKWTFVQPGGVFPTSLVLFGPKVAVSTTDYSPADLVQGSVTVTDLVGASATFSVPSVTLS